MKHFPLFFLLIVETMKWKVMSSCITRLSILTFRQIFIKKKFAFDKTIIQHSKYSRTFTRGEIFSLTQNQCDVCVKKKIDVTFASKWKSMWRLRQNENRCDVCVKMKINVTFASKWKSMWHLRQKEFPMTRSTNVRI